MTSGYASYLLNQYNQEVANWGNAHQYHDPVDGNNYQLDYEYGVNGTGQDGGAALQYAQSTQNIGDYQSAIDIINNNYLHLKALEADYSDKTAYNQPHATDISLMKHYNVYGPNVAQCLVVSFIEQVLRYYVNGKLVRSFKIVSGQYLKPSPPGFWSIFVRQSPTNFKSSEPPGSASGTHPPPLNMPWNTIRMATSSTTRGGEQTLANMTISHITTPVVPPASTTMVATAAST